MDVLLDLTTSLQWGEVLPWAFEDVTTDSTYESKGHEALLSHAYKNNWNQRR